MLPSESRNYLDDSEMPYDWIHMAKMAKPKRMHPFYLPDRPSIYWLDYLIDATPMTITNSKELAQYYDNEVKKFPSVTRLSKPKINNQLTKHSKKSRENFTTTLTDRSSDQLSQLTELPKFPSEQKLSSSRRIRRLSSPGIPREPNVSIRRTEVTSPTTHFSSSSSNRIKSRTNFEKGDCRSPSPPPSNLQQQFMSSTRTLKSISLHETTTAVLQGQTSQQQRPPSDSKYQHVRTRHSNKHVPSTWSRRN